MAIHGTSLGAAPACRHRSMPAGQSQWITVTVHGAATGHRESVMLSRSTLGAGLALSCAADLSIKALVAVRQDRGCPGTAVRASLCTVSQHILRGSSPVLGRKGLQTMRQTLSGTTAPCSHLEGLPNAQPHRQVETRLCPGKDPGDGTQRLQASQSLALGRPAGRGGLLSGSHAASTAMQA